MSTETAPARSYSATVRMSLEIGEHIYNVANAGPAALLVRDPVKTAPCDGVLVIEVDGDIRRTLVRLPNGAVATNPEIAIEVIREAP